MRSNVWIWIVNLKILSQVLYQLLQMPQTLTKKLNVLLIIFFIWTRENLLNGKAKYS